MLPSLLASLVLSGCENPGSPSNDHGAPEIRLLSPVLRDTSVQETQLGLVGEIYDSVGVARVTYQVNDGPEVDTPITPGPTIKYTSSAAFFAPLQAGPNTVWLRAYDEAGNRSEALVYEDVVSDTVKPRIELITEDTTVADARLTLRGIAADNDRVRVVRYRINGGTGLETIYPPADGQFGLDIPLIPGENRVDLIAYDVARNSSDWARLTIQREQELSPALLRSVSVSGAANCGLSATGAAYCWGNNHFEVLGPGFEDLPESPIAVRLAGQTDVRDISVGMEGACLVAGNGAARCWGRNEYGQLGRGSLAALKSSTPEPVVGGHDFVQLSVARTHGCGVTPSGEAFCWGNNSFQQLGTSTSEICEIYQDGSRPCSTVPVAVQGGLGFAMVSVGDGHTCAVTTAAVAYCWGSNSAGGLGAGSTTSSQVPVAVAGEIRWRSVSATWGYTCGLALDGAAYCWGDNSSGQLGDGTTTRRYTPNPVAGGLRFQTVSAGTYHACGLTEEGSAYCWGDQYYLGTGSGTPGLVPVPVAGGLTFRSLDVGHRLACGVTAEDEVYCWGTNTTPQRLLWAGP